MLFILVILVLDFSEEKLLNSDQHDNIVLRDIVLKGAYCEEGHNNGMVCMQMFGK